MKLFISDLDGTLYPKTTPQALQRNIDALREFIDAGNLFAAATARAKWHYEELKQLVDRPLDYIGSNGAEILCHDGTTQFLTLDNSIFLRIVDYLQQHHVDATVATGLHDQWVWNWKDRYPINDPSVYAASFEDAVEMKRNDFESGSDLMRIQIFVKPDQKDVLFEQIKQLNLGATITSSDTNLIDLGPLNCSKAHAIAFLQNKYGIKPEDTYVAGDSDNDMPMFETTANTYCMKNGTQRLKQSAKHIVDSVADILMDL